MKLTVPQRRMLEQCASRYGLRIHNGRESNVMERLFAKQLVIRSCNGTDKWHATQAGRAALALPRADRGAGS